ncbi:MULTISPECIES: GAF and ANTAR domain-containing protein [Nocardioides]|uniref:GAF and ANTAR domain-containing protein n=1 Tax=Nocardioides vastitatis TaxID=2568655 RepID=A0ABW0ZKK3_9ACTN|nr:GAF and ANTAR domain-containing protein [Nocardioides sp.]THI94374.1 GAF and ANTAR domain-containing protein [Nocardioides sp.]
MGELLNRLTGALSVRDREEPLSGRLCDSYRELAGADGAAITVHYETANRVTLCTTNQVAHRLEDLQDVLGEGPGHTASASGQIESCVVPAPASPRWPIFVDAAQDVVDSAQILAVPMHPDRHAFGVITLYQSPRTDHPLALERKELQFLANVVGAALITDTDASDEVTSGPWASRAQIHQATGMVVAQLHISPEDALALLRAHAYGQQTTLSNVATAVVGRRIKFPSTDWWYSS